MAILKNKKALIVFTGGKTAEVIKIDEFYVVQNARKQLIHQVDYKMGDTIRQIIFMNYIEASMLNEKYVRAQSNKEWCAKLEFEKEPEQTS